MAVINVVKYDGAPDVFAWKHPNQELGTWTQLIVNETQEAILYKGGQALDSFGPGRHTLSTNNLPFLNEIINMPFGGRSPFTAEVWYVNKAHVLDIKWGTPTPIQIQDPLYKIFVPVSSYGQMGLTISNARQFLQKLAGNQPQLNSEQLQKYFRGLFLTKVKGIISSYIINKKISVVEINAYISELSELLQKETEPLIEEYGVRLTNFSINDISVPKNDPAVIQLSKALAKRAEMDILGYSYAKERSFDTLEAAVSNDSSAASGILSAGIGLSMGLGIGDSVGNNFKNIAGNLDVGDVCIASAPCPSCGKKDPEALSFCRYCGSSMTVQPKPEPKPEPETQPEPQLDPKPQPEPQPELEPSPAAEGQSTRCGKCGAAYSGNYKFCPECGVRLQRKCGDCGFEINDNIKFCPICGKSVER